MLLFIIVTFIAQNLLPQEEWKIPIHSEDRYNPENITLTEIGDFGRYRKARPSVPGHLHTGIDIKRPGNNYDNEAIYPISKGKVISVRDDGAFAQIIIEHELDKDRKTWSAYEHIAGIVVKVGDIVNADIPIARFMTKSELDKHGWQFDHFHLEILKIKPKKISPTERLPEHHYTTYNLVCYSKEDLRKYYINPISFFRRL